MISSKEKNNLKNKVVSNVPSITNLAIIVC